MKGWGHNRLMSNVGLFFFFPDMSQFLHVGFVLVNKYCPVIKGQRTMDLRQWRKSKLKYVGTDNRLRCGKLGSQTQLLRTPLGPEKCSYYRVS